MKSKFGSSFPYSDIVNFSFINFIPNQRPAKSSTGQKRNFWYRWVAGTGKIFTYADPCTEY